MAKAAKPGTPDVEIITVPDDSPDAWLVLQRESDTEETWTPFRMSECTPAQARAVRNATGQPLRVWIEDIVETGGKEMDAFCVLLWLARMQNGEPRLTLREVEEGTVVAGAWVAGINLADKYRTEPTRPEPDDAAATDLEGDFPEA